MEDSINYLKRNTTAAAGMLVQKERSDAVIVNSRELVRGSALSVQFGQLRSDLFQAISYLISQSPSVVPSDLRSLCELRGNISRPWQLRVRNRPEPASTVPRRLECSANHPTFPL